MEPLWWFSATIPTRFLCPWDFPVKNARVGSHLLLWGIFRTQGSNLGLLHCRWILYCLIHQESLLIGYTPIQNKKLKKKISYVTSSSGPLTLSQIRVRALSKCSINDSLSLRGLGHFGPCIYHEL